jgi:hypothetical protein
MSTLQLEQLGMLAPISREPSAPSPIRPVISPEIKPIDNPRFTPPAIIRPVHDRRLFTKPCSIVIPVVQPIIRPVIRPFPINTPCVNLEKMSRAIPNYVPPRRPVKPVSKEPEPVKPKMMIKPVVKNSLVRPVLQPVLQKEPCRNCGKGNPKPPTRRGATSTADPRAVRTLTPAKLTVDPRLTRQLYNNPLPQPKPPGGGILKPVYKSAVMPAPKPAPKPEPKPAPAAQPVEEPTAQEQYEQQEVEALEVEQVSSDRTKKAAVSIIGMLLPVALSIAAKKIF